MSILFSHLILYYHIYIGSSEQDPPGGMEMKNITTGDMMHTYGCFGADVDYTVRITARLTDPIDPVRLREAIDMTALRYPHFCVKLSKDEAAFYYEDNPLPVALFQTDGRIVLNSPETNGHVWAVCWNEDRLHLDFFHGITDGTGMYAVLATLLYYYGAKQEPHRVPGNIPVAGDPVPAEELADPMDTIQKNTDAIYKAPVFEEAFTLETDGKLMPSPATLWDIEIPEKAFIQFTSANDASPGTMVSLLLARAIDRLYPHRDKKIISAYVINARPMISAVKTYHNCLSMALFSFSDRVKALPFQSQCTVYRGMTFIQSDADRISSVMADNAHSIRTAATGAKTLADKKEIFTQSFNAGEGYITFLVSYIGQWPYPAVTDTIREIWVHPPNTFSLMAEIGAAGGNICLTLQQRFKEDIIREAFLKELDDNNIAYTIRQRIPADHARFPEPAAEGQGRSHDSPRI